MSKPRSQGISQVANMKLTTHKSIKNQVLYPLNRYPALPSPDCLAGHRSLPLDMAIPKAQARHDLAAQAAAAILPPQN